MAAPVGGRTAGILLKAAEILAPKADELSQLITSENGVNIVFQLGNVGGAFGYYANLPYPEPEYRDLYGGAAPTPFEETIVETVAGDALLLLPPEMRPSDPLNIVPRHFRAAALALRDLPPEERQAALSRAGGAAINDGAERVRWMDEHGIDVQVLVRARVSARTSRPSAPGSATSNTRPSRPTTRGRRIAPPGTPIA
jgi:hypothetical protein